MADGERKKKIGKFIVTITHGDKILFPKSKITKNELIAYYEYIASYMLPYLKDHPITMHRFPQGIGHEGFYQKDASDYFPSWIKRVNIPKQEGGDVHYVVCNHAATLVYLANQACITPHIWLSRTDKLDYPDRMIFDLDPSPGVGFKQVRSAAQVLRECLQENGMTPFLMTTGSRGVHVVVPLRRKRRFDEVRAYAQEIAAQLVQDYPKQLTTHIRKAKRGKRIFIDTLRNSFGATAVAPYAVRARQGAPIAMPIDWNMLDEVESTFCTIHNIRDYITLSMHAWRSFARRAVSL